MSSDESVYELGTKFCRDETADDITRKSRPKKRTNGRYDSLNRHLHPENLRLVGIKEAQNVLKEVITEHVHSSKLKSLNIVPGCEGELEMVAATYIKDLRESLREASDKARAQRSVIDKLRKRLQSIEGEGQEG